MLSPTGAPHANAANALAPRPAGAGDGTSPAPPGRGLSLGEVCFADAERRAARCHELEEARMLVVCLDDVGPPSRGRLGEALDAAVERALKALGALGPSIAPMGSDSPDASLSDQLYRARQAGAAGLAFVIGPLAGAAGPLGVLDPADASVLRFLSDATRERPVALILDESDLATSVYGDPIPLDRALSPPSAAGRSSSHAGEAPRAQETAASLVRVDAPVVAFAPAAVEARSRAALLAGVPVAPREEAWRAWTLQLAAARGPLPLAVLERTFVESYVPLGNVIAEGLDDPRACGAHDDFRNAFIKSYTESSPTFAVTSKRPRMVLDAHDVAARLGRLHGARSVRLLLVDSMRWDLSRQVRERVTTLLGPRAMMTDELLLWSALPTTTMRQLETMARGVEALRVPAELEPEPEPLRGRTAEYVRRVRVGPREVHKLDLAEARLRQARGGVLRGLPEIAAACGDVIARHAETLTPRTLLFVFGDHGFTIDRSGSARQGGASPEEVLVGGFALLVGDLH